MKKLAFILEMAVLIAVFPVYLITELNQEETKPNREHPASIRSNKIMEFHEPPAEIENVSYHLGFLISQ